MRTPHKTHTWCSRLALMLVFCLAASLAHASPRMAIMSAFEPELTLLHDALEQPAEHQIKGVRFTTGYLAGQPVVLFLSGVSMVNAAMTTQLALDHFQVSHLVVSGIAGGVNPALNIGDVVVAERWGQYLEMLLARESPDGRFAPPPGKQGMMPHHYGMMFARSVQVRSPGQPDIHRKFWFEADPEMLRVARSLSGVRLKSCNAEQQCLSRAPQVVVGGNAVSGSAFVDNAAFRAYSFEAFQANVLDMESAACAHVAYSNGVPFIAFRALSDLAGGGPGVNEMPTFMSIAAENSAQVVLAFLEAWNEH